MAALIALLLPFRAPSAMMRRSSAGVRSAGGEMRRFLTGPTMFESSNILGSPLSGAVAALGSSGAQSSSMLALTLSVLGGRAADTPNLVLAGVITAMLAPVTVFLLAQRYFVENVASSGLKG